MARINVACAYHGLTAVVLPFTTTQHNPPRVPDDRIDMLKAAQPQVLILPAGLAVEDLKSVKSLKTVIVVDISSDPHMDWTDQLADISVQNWNEVLEITEHYEHTEPANVAVQSFVPVKDGYKSIEFTQQVFFFALRNSL